MVGVNETEDLVLLLVKRVEFGFGLNGFLQKLVQTTHCELFCVSKLLKFLLKIFATKFSH